MFIKFHAFTSKEFLVQTSPAADTKEPLIKSNFLQALQLIHFLQKKTQVLNR